MVLACQITETFVVFIALLVCVMRGTESGYQGSPPLDITCAPGEYVSCYDEDNYPCDAATCAVCPQNTFNKHQDASRKCADCTTCAGRAVVTNAPCSRRWDAVCDCDFGFYAYRLQSEGGLICVKNSSCNSPNILQKKHPGSPLTCEMEPVVTVAPMATSENAVVPLPTPMFPGHMTQPVTSRDWVTLRNSYNTTNGTGDATVLPQSPHMDMTLRYVVVVASVVGLSLLAVILGCCGNSMFNQYLKHKERQQVLATSSDREKAVLMNNGIHKNEIFPDKNHYRSLQNEGNSGDFCHPPSLNAHSNVSNGIPSGPASSNHISNDVTTPVMCQECELNLYNIESRHPNNNPTANVPNQVQPSMDRSQNLNRTTSATCPEAQVEQNLNSDDSGSFWMELPSCPMGSAQISSGSQPPLWEQIALLHTKETPNPRNLLSDEQTSVKRLAEEPSGVFNLSLPSSVVMPESLPEETQPVSNGSDQQLAPSAQLQLCSENHPPARHKLNNHQNPTPSVHYNITVAEGGTVNLHSGTPNVKNGHPC